MDGTGVSFGAVDIGTNSMRLLIVNAEGQELHREGHVTGLGTGVDATGRFDPDRVSETLDVMSRFGDRAREFGVDHMLVVATSASRDADNGPGFIDEVHERLGYRPEIISGEREAELSFRGANAGHEPRRGLIIDVGGGSTEFIIGTETAEDMVSVDMGSVRLTDRCLTTRPTTVVQVQAAREHASSVLAVPFTAEGTEVIGVAGTFSTIATVQLGLAEHNRDVVDGTRITLREVDAIVDRLTPLSVEETADIPGIHPRRARVILGGAIVVRCALAAVQADAVTVSETDLLDALAEEARLG